MKKRKKNYFGPIANVKVGDEIELQYDADGEDEPNIAKIDFGKGKVKKVKIMAILGNDPFNYKGDSNGLKIITTKEMGEKLTGEKEIKPVDLNIVLKDVKYEDTG